MAVEELSTSKASPLSAVLDEQDKLMADLGGSLDALEKRLTPLLRETVPEPSGPEKTTPESQPCGPVVAQLTGRNERLISMDGHVRDLLDRLDV